MMVDPSAINVSELPSVALEDRFQLPPEPCVYFAFDSQGAVQYIGRSVNLQQRWQNHHRYNDLLKIDGVRIAYASVALDLLPEVEVELIKVFDPPLNGRRIRDQSAASMKRLSASIPGKLYERLEKLAEYEGRSVSNLVSFLLEHSIEQKIAGYQEGPRSPTPGH